MSTKAPLERSLKSDRARHNRGVKAARQRLVETEQMEELDLFPLPYVVINEDGTEEEVYINQERNK